MKKIYYLIHSTNWGDTFLSTPTVRYLSKSHQQPLNIVTHRKDVFKNNPYVNKVLSFDEFNSLNVGDIIKYESFTYAGRKDQNGIEKKFAHFDGRQLHASDLGFQLPNEDLEYDFFPDPLSLDISLPEKYVVLHVTTNWPNRTWDYNNWVGLIKWLKDNNIFTVLIGFGYREILHSSYSDKPLDKECPMFDDYYGLDLTNKGSMSDMYWVIKNSQAIITMDSAPLHLASCTDAHIIQLGSAINPAFKRFYRNGDWQHKYHFMGGTCNIFCNTNLFYNIREWGDINSVPPQPLCLEKKPTFECHPKLPDIIDKLIEILEMDEVQSYEGEKNLKFGIYTSFYNCEKYIDRIFSSIESINYNNFEWHITDDFSTDNTKYFILDRLEKSPIKDKIKYCEQSEKKQMYWKPNQFFDETFDWIILVDADDDFDKNFLNVYNSFLREKNDVTLVSSDFFKINEDNDSLHSISYVLNDDIITKKINKYHPNCDYLNNISYSCFGHLRGFKNIIPSFEVDDMLACAEDSYHVFWLNSFGKYLHIPRPLYTWYLREDSESHSKSIPPNFNANFNISFNKLLGNDGGVDTMFNELYLETCSLGSCDIGTLSGKKVSLWTRNLSENQKEILRKLYYDTHLVFNNTDAEIHVYVLNHHGLSELNLSLQEVKGKKMWFYYQNQNNHENNQEKDIELDNQLNKYLRVISHHTGYSWWKYIRHFIISN